MHFDASSFSCRGCYYYSCNGLDSESNARVQCFLCYSKHVQLLSIEYILYIEHRVFNHIKSKNQCICCILINLHHF